MCREVIQRGRSLGSPAKSQHLETLEYLKSALSLFIRGAWRCANEADGDQFDD
jgi:hypothetical protein